MNLLNACLILIIIFLVDFGATKRPFNQRNNNNDMFKEIDGLLKNWNRIGRRICQEERMSEQKNSQLYNCLRDTNDLESGYENQLLKRCELHILKTRRLTKNQVRLALCRNNHHIIEKFSVCHTKMKENRPAKLNSKAEFNKMIRKETKKIRSIVTCIERTLES